MLRDIAFGMRPASALSEMLVQPGDGQHAACALLQHATNFAYLALTLATTALVPSPSAPKRAACAVRSASLSGAILRGGERALPPGDP